jgi:hypothetical protein
VRSLSVPGTVGTCGTGLLQCISKLNRPSRIFGIPPRPCESSNKSRRWPIISFSIIARVNALMTIMKVLNRSVQDSLRLPRSLAPISLESDPGVNVQYSERTGSFGKILATSLFFSIPGILSIIRRMMLLHPVAGAIICAGHLKDLHRLRCDSMKESLRIVWFFD